jgi:hypothetical protein
MSKAGMRELVYFLSRFPRARTTGSWMYEAGSDAWTNPETGGRMRVGMEGSASVAACLYAGLTREQIERFVRRNAKE